MSAVETEIFNESTEKPLVWEKYIDDVFSFWNISIEDINEFIEQANRHHPTIKFTAKISDKETIFLDTCIYKGDISSISSCHPPRLNKGFIKGEALRLLRINSLRKSFEENIRAFRSRLHATDYPYTLLNSEKK